jgi:restriction endonuclease S subunit
MGQAPAGDTYNTLGNGVALIAGAGDFSGGILAPKKFTDKPTKLSEPGDIVLSIRASIGDKVWADQVYCLGRGVAALRAKPSIDSNYLWHWVSASRRTMMGKAKGATFLQVNRSDIGELLIAVPPLDEQRRIAAILDKADELRTKRRQALARLDDLTPAIFRQMFGDVRRPKEGIQMAPIGSLCNLVRGSSPRPQGDPRFFGGPIPRLMIADITRDGDLVTPRIDSLTIAGAAKSRPVPAGTVVMAVSGNIGLSAILSVDACIHDGFVGFTGLDASRVVPKYLQTVFKVGRTLHDSGVAGAIFKNITTTDIKKTHIPLPPFQAQLEFERLVSAVERTRNAHRKQLSELDSLFESLQYRAFTGQL